MSFGDGTKTALQYYYSNALVPARGLTVTPGNV